MWRCLLRRAFPILIFAALLFGQGATDGQKSSLPAPSSASPSAVTQAGSTPSNISTIIGEASDLLTEANRHYRRGEFDAAIESYNAVLQKNPISPDAYAGLARVYLKQKEADQAFEIATKGLAATNSPTVDAALGEVLFRQGKIPEAEREWVNIINTGYPNARAYWGLARVRTAISLYAQAKQLLDKAHELDPTDPDIQKYWINSLSRPEQIQYWENYLASPTNDDAETRADMQHHLDYLLAMEKQPNHACHLVNSVPSTEMNLLRILADPIHIYRYGLAVSVNGKKGNLVLDTGASGILIDQGMARKADITEVSETAIGGIGDKGRAGGFFGFANSIKIGDLEFQDCRVSVIEKRSVLGDDGLIGADVFNNFLVDIDFPKEKLRLEPLPRRPDEKASDAALPTSREGSGSNGGAPPGEAGSSPGAKSSPPAHHGPRDRYIAPEMQSYTQVYRFGHDLLIPTRIGDQPPRLLLIDTGAGRTQLSLQAAEESTKVHNDPLMHVNGLNGSVAQVYKADKAVLQFGHLRQENQDVITFDLSHLSDRVGTEISGTLGFSTLILLEIHIDYRDGIVDFAYHPR